MDADDRLKLGYQATIQLIGSTSQLILASFNTILAANALLGVFGGAMLRLFDAKLVSLAVSILGIGVCFVWFFSLKRNFAYLKYYYACAREIEATALLPEIQTLQRGRLYGTGESVTVCESEVWRMPWTARIFRIEFLSTLIVSVVALSYVFLFWLALTTPVPPLPN